MSWEKQKFRNMINPNQQSDGLTVRKINVGL